MRPDTISIKRQIASLLFNMTKWHAWLPTKECRILMYHRITNPEEEPIPQLPGMYVRPKTFRSHLEYLSKHFKIIPLEEIIKMYSNKLTTKEKYIALTFDDAWIDFKTNALPILQEFNAPATVFVPTKFIDTGEFFWNDIVQLAIHNGTPIECSPESSKPQDLTKVIEELKLDRTKRENLVRLLKSKLSKELKSIPSQFLSWEDIQNISKNGLISFGSHSHSHHISTQITNQEFESDVTLSQSEFNKHSIELSQTFCYPNQNRNNETDQTLSSLGFSSALGILDEPSNFAYTRIGIHEDISSNNSLFSLTLGV